MPQFEVGMKVRLLGLGPTWTVLSVDRFRQKIRFVGGQYFWADWLFRPVA